jgi:hypothetical protein
MTNQPEKSKDEIKCVDCSRILLPEEELRKWGPCQSCNKPVCFNCSHYIAARVKGLYEEYMEVRRTCSKCHPRAKPL